MNRLAMFLMLATLLSACGSGEQDTAQKSPPITADLRRSSDVATVQKGFRLYQENCATCHGSEGQGAPNWQQVGADGKYPPPPLNGTGHAWHHPQAALVRTIKHGTVAIGGKMPALGEKLDDEEIAAVITWFQSRWPDELYQAWARMDRQSRQN